MGSIAVDTPNGNERRIWEAPFKYTGTLDGFEKVACTPCIGTEFKNVDLAEWLRAPNSDDMLRDLAVIMAQRGVIFFRGQKNIDNTLQKELCLRLNRLTGNPETHGFYRHSLLAMQGEDPEMGKVDQDRIRKMYADFDTTLPRQDATKEWHTDSSFEPNPPDYTILRLSDVPSSGGDTIWTSGYELYDRLSPPYKKFFESLTATHHSVALYGAAQKDPSQMDPKPRGAPNNKGLDFSSHHPVIRTHPISGWKTLFAWGVNFHRFDGVTLDESAELKNKITKLVVNNHDTQVRFRWESPSDLAIWDNRCTFHAATGDHFGVGKRVGWRCMTMGEVPFLAENSIGRAEATGGRVWEDKYDW